MFVNPNILLSEKIITFPPQINISSYIQPNGIDVDCTSVVGMPEAITIIGNDFSLKPIFAPIQLEEIYNGRKGWFLRKGNAYSFSSNFSINIPKGMCGWLIGRSSFNRYGVLVRSGLYDSGFNGTIGGTIYCLNDVKIEQNTRIAQLVVSTAEEASMYNGQWQNQQ